MVLGYEAYGSVKTLPIIKLLNWRRLCFVSSGRSAEWDERASLFSASSLHFCFFSFCPLCLNLSHFQGYYVSSESQVLQTVKILNSFRNVGRKGI